MPKAAKKPAAVTADGLTIRRVPIESLTHDPDNARLHDETNLEAIRASLTRFQQCEPLVVQKSSGKVVGGNGRLTAMKSLGWHEVDIVERDLTDDEATALGVALNRTAELATWDAGTLTRLSDSLRGTDLALAGLGFSDEALTSLARAAEAERIASAEKPEKDPDDVPADVEATCQPGDMWQLGDHRLFCGDCTDSKNWRAMMGGEKAECIFTSPPYAVGVDYGEYEDNIQNLRTLIAGIASVGNEHVVDGGFVVLNFSDIASGKELAQSDGPCEYPMALEYWPVFRHADYVLWSRRIWCKPNHMVRSLQCISSNRAATDWEHIWTWKRSGNAIVARVDGEHSSSCNGWIDSSAEDTLDIGKETHGAGMPTMVARRMLCVHSQPSALVMEPFCGTGTTLIAAEQIGRRCMATELNPKFCDIILRRWSEFTGKDPVLISDTAASDGADA